MKSVIFPVSARQFGIKDMLDGHAGVEVFRGDSYGRLHEWSEAYFVTLIDRCALFPLCFWSTRDHS